MRISRTSIAALLNQNEMLNSYKRRNRFVLQRNLLFLNSIDKRCTDSDNRDFRYVDRNYIFPRQLSATNLVFQINRLPPNSPKSLTGSGRSHRSISMVGFFLLNVTFYTITASHGVRGIVVVVHWH